MNHIIFPIALIIKHKSSNDHASRLSLSLKFCNKRAMTLAQFDYEAGQTKV